MRCLSRSARTEPSASRRAVQSSGRKNPFFGAPQQRTRQCFPAESLELLLEPDKILDVAKKERVDSSEGRDLFDGHALAESVGDEPETVSVGLAEVFLEEAAVTLPSRGLQAGAAGFEERMALWSASLNVLPMAIVSPTDFIWVVRCLTSSGTSRKRTGNLDDHIIDGRLEAGRRLPGDVVPDFVERVADASLAAILAIGKPVAFEARQRSGKPAGSSR